MLLKHKVCIVIVTLAMLINISACSLNHEKNYSKKEHRRQSWLTEINWDDNRLDYTGRNITVAIVDSGIDTETTELHGKVVLEKKIVSDGKKNDTKHGTAVASIIAAEPYTEKNVEGIATGVSIVSIDVTDQENGRVNVKDLADGINFAVDNKVDIINVSVGCLENNRELKNAVDRAIDSDIIIVASAGNYTKDDILYPSKYDGVLSVGSLSKQRKIKYPQGNIKKKVIYLPGENIVAAIGKGKYTGCDGTSFSNAICSGLVALLLEKNNDKEAVKRYIEGIDFTDSIDFVSLVENYK